jgi:predicted alpha/beta superfamily hydrolase
VFFVVARRAAPSVALCCAVQSAMERVGDEADLWALSTRVEGIGSAVLDVMIFAEVGETAPPVTRSAQWRGPDAPSRAETAEIPQGLLSVHEIESAALNERRVIEVYRPAGDGPMPVIYMADGESVSMFAQTIQPLIARGDLPPVMIVGLHSGPKTTPEGEDPGLIRHQEYLPGWAGETQPRYVSHDRFLTEEVIPLAESLGASSRREDRAVAGYSNGAAWAMAMATDHPDLFGKVMALSFGWKDDAFFARIRETRYGDVWIGAGTLEPPFHNLSEQTATVLAPLADRVIFDSRVAGHSPVMWHDQFPVAALWLFSPDRLSVE